MVLISHKSEKSLDLTEKLKTSAKVYDGKLLQVYRDVVTMAPGTEEIREVLRHPGAAVIVPYQGQSRFVLVRQFRHALGRETLEFPAGRLEPGEDPESCARRELAEETGYQAQSWSKLFSMHPAPGYTDELLHLYLAQDLIAGPSHPDDDEQVLTVEATLDQLLVMFHAGKITDAKTLTAILYLQAFPSALAL
jgi:ADP-ribose pyrophosphatase